MVLTLKVRAQFERLIPTALAFRTSRGCFRFEAIWERQQHSDMLAAQRHMDLAEKRESLPPGQLPRLVVQLFPLVCARFVSSRIGERGEDRAMQDHPNIKLVALRKGHTNRSGS